MMDEDQITQLAVSFKTHGSQLVHPQRCKV